MITLFWGVLSGVLDRVIGGIGSCYQGYLDCVIGGIWIVLLGVLDRVIRGTCNTELQHRFITQIGNTELTQTCNTEL